MKKQHFQWVLMSLGLAVSVGCTVPFLVNPDGSKSSSGGQVITDPQAVSSSLPIFLPQPGGSAGPPLILDPETGGFIPVASSNPGITGPLPSPTATPFLADLRPNIDNQIMANPLPTLQNNGGGGLAVGSNQPIVKSIIKGRVLGFNLATEGYEPLANAQVKVDSNISLTTDVNGFYQTSQEFDTRTSISAAFENYTASTVTDVPPGIDRDIHLNPLKGRTPYRQDVFKIQGSVTNLARNGKRPLVVYTDSNASISNAAFTNSTSGRFDIDVQLKANRSTSQGSLFASVMDNVGKLSTVTQYGFSPNVSVPQQPNIPVPTPTPDSSGQDNPDFRPLKSTDLLLSFDHLVSPEAFGELKVNLSAVAGNIPLQGSILHVYMNLPQGGRVLVAKYNDNTSVTINQTIRVPRIANTTFTLEAHAGSALVGSDIVVPNLQIGSTIVRSFLPIPQFNQVGEASDLSNLNKTHFVSSDTTPQFGWETQANVNSFQLDLTAEIPAEFHWEAYTLANRLTYPDFGTEHPLSLKQGKTYRLQLTASDFDLGTFNILSLGNQWQAPTRFEQIFAAQSQSKGDFGLKLRNPTLNNFAQGYRIAYSTVSFVTE